MRKPSMKTTDMTVGNPLRIILAFAIPIFIGNIFQQIYSVVDTMVAGYNLGDSAIAAIGATSSLYGLIINLAWGMNSGFALVVTRSFGAHDRDTLRKSIAGTMLLDFIVTAVVTLLSICFLRPLMHLMNTPDSIFSDAYSYMFIICLGMAGAVAYNMFSSLLRAVGNSVTPLYFLIVSSVANILLDLLFVVGLHLGMAGAAAATVVAELLSAVLSGAYFIRRYREILPTGQDFRLSAAMLRDLLSNGLAMAFMYCVVDLGSVFFQGANNRLGDAVIAAHTAARRLIGIMMAPLGTISGAAATFIGQNWGAERKDRVREGLKQEILLSVVWGALACGVIYLCGEWLVRFTTGSTDPITVRNAVMSLRIHLPFYPALGVLLALRTAMQAVNIKIPPVLSSAMELGMKILAAFWLIPIYGFVGTCVTEPITWVLCAVFLTVVYLARRGYFYDDKSKEMENDVEHDF